MPHAIRILRLEHERLAKLLDLMDRLYEQILNGHAPDFRLFHEIGGYLSGFPDQVHHPKEDLIYRKMRKRNARSKEGPGSLVHEHEELSKLTTYFIECVGQAERDSDKWMENFQIALRKLINYYRHHMEMEEAYFFPAAIEQLTKSDWAKVTYAISEQVDPLFDEATIKFEKLRREIHRMAEANDEQLASRNQLLQVRNDLQSLHSADQLLSMMNDQYPQMKFRIATDGGFRLEVENRTLLEIPECDEQRATWSAYCFLKGMSASR
jgi:hemerythrin-like domain-containing protein